MRFRKPQTDKLVWNFTARTLLTWLLQILRCQRRYGLEVIAELQQTFPDTKIIAITAYIDEYLVKIWDAGIDRILQKPFQIKELLDVVKEALKEN